MLARVDSIYKRIANACSAIHDIQRRLKVVFFDLFLSQFHGVFIRYPTGIDGIHVNALLGKISGGGMGQHIQCGLGHIGMRMTLFFGKAIKFALHSGNIDNVFLTGKVFFIKGTSRLLRTNGATALIN